MCQKYRPASTYFAGVEGAADAAAGSARDAESSTLSPLTRLDVELDRIDSVCTEHWFTDLSIEG